MEALPDLITVAQFRELPEDEAYLYELHHGEVVALPRPKSEHIPPRSLLARSTARLSVCRPR